MCRHLAVYIWPSLWKYRMCFILTSDIFAFCFGNERIPFPNETCTVHEEIEWFSLRVHNTFYAWKKSNKANNLFMVDKWTAWTQQNFWLHYTCRLLRNHFHTFSGISRSNAMEKKLYICTYSPQMDKKKIYNITFSMQKLPKHLKNMLQRIEIGLQSSTENLLYFKSHVTLLCTCWDCNNRARRKAVQLSKKSEIEYYVLRSSYYSLGNSKGNPIWWTTRKWRKRRKWKKNKINKMNKILKQCVSMSMAELKLQQTEFSSIYTQSIIHFQ